MILTLTLLLIGAWLVFWPWIRQFLESKLIPTVRDLFNEKVAGWLADFTCWLDDRATGVRRFSKEAWAFLKHRVLRIRSRYTRITSSSAEQETETWLHADSGKVIRRVTTETLNWEDLPEKIRSEMIRQNKKKSEMDIREAILERAHRKAAEEGIAVGVAG